MFGLFCGHKDVEKVEKIHRGVINYHYIEEKCVDCGTVLEKYKKPIPKKNLVDHLYTDMIKYIMGLTEEQKKKCLKNAVEIANKKIRDDDRY